MDYDMRNSIGISARCSGSLLLAFSDRQFFIKRHVWEFGVGSGLSLYVMVRTYKRELMGYYRNLCEMDVSFARLYRVEYNQAC